MIILFSLEFFVPTSSINLNVSGNLFFIGLNLEKFIFMYADELLSHCRKIFDDLYCRSIPFIRYNEYHFLSVF